MKKDPIAMIKKARKRGEPTFTIRAKDTLSLVLLETYIRELQNRIAADDKQGIDFLQEVIDIQSDFRTWRANNIDKVKMPD